MDKLTIEDVENWDPWLDGDAAQTYLAKQLLDTLRENHRLREELAKHPLKGTIVDHADRQWVMENGSKIDFVDNGEPKWTSLYELHPEHEASLDFAEGDQWGKPSK